MRNTFRGGYRTHVTSYSNDYGLDVLAENDRERIAVQAKQFGQTSRQVNRQMFMELQGVKDYFDCDRAVMATDGIVREDAKEVAAKLGIEILAFPADLEQGVRPNGVQPGRIFHMS
jgi:restriction system protein